MKRKREISATIRTCVCCGADISDRRGSAKYCTTCAERCGHEKDAARRKRMRQEKKAGAAPSVAANPQVCWRRDCRHWTCIGGSRGSTPVCDYILHMHRRRPCPVGSECTAYEPGKKAALA
jgi:hypothetical protein